MRAGRLRKRVVIQKKSVILGTTGEEIVTWENMVTVWAEVTSVANGGDEKPVSNADQLRSRGFSEVKLRYRPVSVQQRLLLDGRVMSIHSVVDPDGRQRELHLVASEVLN